MIYTTRTFRVFTKGALLTSMLLFQVLPVYAVTSTTVSVKDIPIVDEIELILQKPQPKITIPGLTFTNTDQLPQSDEDGSQYLFVPYIGEYIATVYKYLVAIVGIVAVIMIIAAGVVWTSSGGSSERIGHAKTMITRAMIGLLISVSSYTMLFTINPELVSFRNLRILVLQGIGVDNIGDPAMHSGENGDTAGKAHLIKKPSSIPADQIRYANPSPTKKTGTFIVDCSMFENSAAGRSECRKACNNQLPEDMRSKAAQPAYQSEYLGALDCSNQNIRKLSDISIIGIHEGGVGAISWWWYLLVENQAPIGSHYFITRSGTVIQLLDERFYIWHGVENKKSIGIDLDAGCSSSSSSPAESAKCNYTPAQYDALNKLIADISTRIGKTPTLIGHCEVGKPDNAKAHIDPRNFDWTKLGSTNSAHRKGKCLYVPGYTPGTIPSSGTQNTTSATTVASPPATASVCCLYQGNQINIETEKQCTDMKGTPLKSGPC